jgi:hypothetical protein
MDVYVKKHLFEEKLYCLRRASENHFNRLFSCIFKQGNSKNKLFEKWGDSTSRYYLMRFAHTL